MDKGIVYYTDNVLKKPFLKTIRKRLKLSAGNIPIVWVSQKPIDEENNIVWGKLSRNYYSMCLQILSGIQAIKADVIYFAEHDVIYHPSHFDFIPPREDTFYYNQNKWWLRSKNGLTSFPWKVKNNKGFSLSQLVAYKELLKQHYIERVKCYESGIKMTDISVEPGHRSTSIFTNCIKVDNFCSQWPNIDIRHGNNYTVSNRFISHKYILANGIPFWGITKNRYKEFMKEIK